MSNLEEPSVELLGTFKMRDVNITAYDNHNQIVYILIIGFNTYRNYVNKETPSTKKSFNNNTFVVIQNKTADWEKEDYEKIAREYLEKVVDHMMENFQ